MITMKIIFSVWLVRSCDENAQSKLGRLLHQGSSQSVLLFTVIYRVAGFIFYFTQSEPMKEKHTKYTNKYLYQMYILGLILAQNAVCLTPNIYFHSNTRIGDTGEPMRSWGDRAEQIAHLHTHIYSLTFVDVAPVSSTSSNTSVNQQLQAQMILFQSGYRGDHRLNWAAAPASHYTWCSTPTTMVD